MTVALTRGHFRQEPPFRQSALPVDPSPSLRYRNLLPAIFHSTEPARWHSGPEPRSFWPPSSAWRRGTRRLRLGLGGRRLGRLLPALVLLPLGLLALALGLIALGLFRLGPLALRRCTRLLSATIARWATSSRFVREVWKSPSPQTLDAFDQLHAWLGRNVRHRLLPSSQAVLHAASRRTWCATCWGQITRSEPSRSPMALPVFSNVVVLSNGFTRGSMADPLPSCGPGRPMSGR